MPRGAFPPTPDASTDISGKENAALVQAGSHFALPPSAMGGRDTSSVTSACSRSSDSSYDPVSPLTPTARRQPATAGRKGREEFELPPPPTRTCKIIQMKPPAKQQTATQARRESSQSTAIKAEQGPPGKGKKAGSTTAGRKIARKTAHSLIERRRRSKMNEEFGVLKNMIPACAGQEMHKLSILQASIEYLRYLEKCITDLKAKTRQSDENTPFSTFDDQVSTLASRDNTADVASSEYDDGDDDRDDDDEEMTDEPPRSQTPTLPAMHPHQHSTSYSSTTSWSPTGPSPSLYAISSHSTTTSPSILPRPSFTSTARQSHYPPTFSGSSSANPSPTIYPQSSIDHEASAALLMLNADRRGSGGSVKISPPSSAGPGAARLDGMRGMSVRDLISS